MESGSKPSANEWCLYMNLDGLGTETENLGTNHVFFWGGKDKKPGLNKNPLMGIHESTSSMEWGSNDLFDLIKLID